MQISILSSKIFFVLTKCNISSIIGYMKGVTVRGSIRNPKELASLVGRCNVFLYLSLPFCRQLIKNKQLGDIEVLKRSIGKTAGELAKMASKAKTGSGFSKPRREPPKRFDAMTEGRKVSQAKKRIKNKKSKESAFAEIGRIIKEAGIGQKQKPTTTIKKSSMSNPNYRKEASKIRRKAKTGKMGGGKIYASMDKKYGGGIFPRKGKM